MPRKVVCAYCQKVYIFPYLKKETKFCSVECKNNSHRVKTTCAYCNKSIERIKTKVGLNVFCNRSCSTSHKNNSKKDLIKDVQAYLKSIYCKAPLVSSDRFDIYLPEINLAIDLSFKPGNLEHADKNELEYYLVEKDRLNFIKYLIKKNLNSL